MTDTITKIDDTTLEISTPVPPVVTTRTLADIQAEIDSKTAQIEDCTAQIAVYTARIEYLNGLKDSAIALGITS